MTCLKTVLLLVAALASSFPAPASAQVRAGSALAGVQLRTHDGGAGPTAAGPPSQPIRESLRTIDIRPAPPLARAQTLAQAPTGGRERSTTRRVLGAAVGAAAGFFGGGYLGAAIEGDSCNCDDPGLKGALIGAPVGGVTGGILGALFLF